MSNQEKFQDTVSILVKAYLNGTLEHANCSACAVGNIIAARTGTEPVLYAEMQNNEFYRWKNGVRTLWQRVFITTHWTMTQKFNLENLHGAIQEQINASGYNMIDLAKIEYAFEKTPEFEGDRMFNGLMNVVDVLASIHQIDLTSKAAAKELFVKA